VRNETESVIASACTGIGKVLLFADVNNEVFGLGRSSYYHSLVYRGTCGDKELTALLSVEQTVCNSLTCLKRNE
jgi:hypothetical protein